MGGTTPFRLGYRPALDGLRGIALVIVMLFHAQFPFVQLGHHALDVFFVLSGFLVTVLLVTEWDTHGRIHLGHFTARRALRIYPALVVFLLAVGLFVQTTTSAATTQTQWRSVVSAFVGVSNWVEALTDHDLLLVQHTWSIAVEWQFYLLWPLVLVLLLRRGTDPRRIAVGLAVAIVVTMGVRGLWWHQRWTADNLFPRLYVGTDMRIDHLMIGALLGLAAARDWLRVSDRVRRATAVAAACGVAYLVWLTVAGPSFGFLFAGGSTLSALSSAAVILATLVAPTSLVPRVLARRTVVWLGTVSYAAYLWHVPIYRVMRERWPDHPVLLRAAAGGAATLVLAGLSYRLVEQTFLRLKHRFVHVHDDHTAGDVVGGREPIPVESASRA